MKNIYFKIILLVPIIVIFGALPIFCESKGSNFSFSEWILNMWVDRPIFAYYDQTMFSRNNSGISKLGFALDGIKNNTTINSHEFAINQDYRRVQFCNISVGYKYNDGNQNKSFPFVDFSLFHAYLFDQFSGGACFGINCNIFNKKTTWYSTNDIEWINLGISLGYNFIPSKTFTLAPIFNLGFGLETLKADTINCPNLETIDKSYNYQFMEGEAKLLATYKPFSLEISASGKGGNAERQLVAYKFSSELSYTLWDEIQDTAYNGTKYQYFLNYLKLYLSYNNEIARIENSSNSENTFPHRYKNSIIKFGISGRLGKIEFYKD